MTDVKRLSSRVGYYQGRKQVVKRCAGAHVSSESGVARPKVEGLVRVAAPQFQGAAPFLAFVKKHVAAYCITPKEADTY